MADCVSYSLLGLNRLLHKLGLYETEKKTLQIVLKASETDREGTNYALPLINTASCGTLNAHK